MQQLLVELKQVLQELDALMDRQVKLALDLHEFIERPDVRALIKELEK